MNRNWLIQNLELLATPLLLALANPGTGLPCGWILGWLAWIPLCSRLFKMQTWREQLRDGFVLGSVFHLWITHWLSSLHPMMWMGLSPQVSFIAAHLAWLVISMMGGLYIAPLWLLICQVFRRPANRMILFIFQTILASLIWAIGFYLMHLSPLGLPIGFNAYSQVAAPWGSSAINHLSFWGVEALIFCFAVFTIKAVSEKQNRVAYSLLSLVCVLAPISCGLLIPTPKNPLQDVPVVLLSKQPDIETIRSERYSPNDYVHVFEQEFAKKKKGWGLVILPEGALPHQNTPFKGITHEILIAGAFIYENGNVYNGAVIRYPDGHQDFVRKRILVPFGETTPLVPESLVRDALRYIEMDYSTGDLSAGPLNGPNAEPLDIDIENPITHQKHHFSLGILVCFETFYPSLYWSKRPDRIINMSNLSWFHDNQQLKRQVEASQKNNPI